VVAAFFRQATVTTLALAPIMVPFPPDRPRETATTRAPGLRHGNGLVQEGDNGQHGGGEGNVVKEGRGNGAHPQDNDDAPRGEIAAGEVLHPFGL